jgi:FkbM family methyltransferase
MIEQVYKAYRLIKYNHKFLSFLMKKGASLTSLEVAIGLKNNCGNLNTIIDVGANIGQFALANTIIFKDAMIYSFEPIPEVYSELKRNISGNNNISSFQTALGSQDGSIEFNVNEYSPASSILNTIDVPENGTDSLVVKKIEVPIQKLDKYLEVISLKKPSLLKLDVQGYEKETLIGSEKILKFIDFLLIEMSFIPSYNQEILFVEMDNFLKSLGFSFVTPLAFLQDRDYKILQMDALYKRA